jgi:hypothetical protein
MAPSIGAWRALRSNLRLICANFETAKFLKVLNARHLLAGLGAGSVVRFGVNEVVHHFTPIALLRKMFGADQASRAHAPADGRPDDAIGKPIEQRQQDHGQCNPEM